MLAGVLASNKDTDQTAGMLSLIRAFGVGISLDDMRSFRHYKIQKQTDIDFHTKSGAGSEIILALVC